MPNFGLGAGQIGTSWSETGVTVGDARRYKTHDVVRLAKSKVKFSNYNIYIPGEKKRSIADQKVDLLFEKQQESICESGQFTTPRFIKKESLESECEVEIKNEKHPITKPFFSKNADPEMIKQYYERIF